MLTTADYDSPEPLYGGRRTLVVRMRRKRGSGTVVVKCLRDPSPPRLEVARLRHEFGCMRKLDSDAVVRPIEMTHSSQGVALVMEDFGGVSLHQELQRRREPLELGLVLQIGVRVCDALGALHDVGLVHRDVKPHNIIVNFATGRVALSDLGIAAAPTGEPSGEFVGSPHFVSPEQTGRIARGVDHRSDLYSFGVTLYLLCTGVLPFAGDDPLELVHCAIARVPTPPHVLAPKLPLVVSRIIAKVIAKDPERRYQSARGLRADLQRCRDALAAGGELLDFPLGQDDVAEAFQISEVLVGREPELLAIDGAAGGLAVVHGPPGSGRSALVRGVERRAATRGHQLVRCVGDADLARTSPYGPLWLLLRELLRRRLSASEAAAAEFRDRVRERLDDQLALALPHLPELAALVDPGPAPDRLLPGEADQRLRLALLALLRLCAELEGELVVFVDDVQHLGVPALQVIATALLERRIARISWVFTARPGDLTGPLADLCRDVPAAGLPFTSIALRPLSVAEVEQIVGDTLSPAVADAPGLAALLHARSLGLPRVVADLLRTVGRDAFRYDRDAHVWRWDAAIVRSAALADDIFAELAARAAALPAATREVLALAGCVGPRVPLADLAVAARRPLPALAADLEAAVDHGLVRRDGDDDDAALAFAAPGLAAVVAADLDAPRRAEVHLDLARHMLQRTCLKGHELFTMLEHFARAGALLRDRGERLVVAEHHLAGGREALSGGAYAYAIDLLRRGVDLLPPDPWAAAPRLTFELHRACVEAEYLGGQVDAALARFEPLLAGAADELERMDLFGLRLDLELAVGDLYAAFHSGRRALALFGVDMPERVGPAQIALEIARTRWALRGRSLADLEALPVATDPRVLRLEQLLHRLVGPAMLADPAWLTLLMLRQLGALPRTGLTPYSTQACVYYASVLIGGFDDIAGGAAYADLSRRIQAQLCDPYTIGRLDEHHGMFITPWTQPWSEALRELQDGARKSEANGDAVIAAFSLLSLPVTMYLAGEELTRVRAVRAENRATLQRRLGPDFYECYRIETDLLLNLLDEPHDPRDGPVWREDEFLAARERFPVAQLVYHKSRANLAVLAGEFSLALPHVEAALARVQLLFSNVVLVDLHFLAALCYAGLLRGAGPLERLRLRAKLTRQLAKLDKYAAHNEANFGARRQLAHGAAARSDGRPGDALLRYNRAIELARRHGSPHLEAIAGEHAARLCFETGDDSVGATYLHGALRAYDRWGARARVRALQREFAAHVPAEVDVSTTTASSTTPSNPGSASARLDLASALKAAQAISGEIALDRLLRTLVAVVMENAGARRVVIALRHDQHIFVEADATLEPHAVAVMQGVKLGAYPRLPRSLLAYVARTREPVVLRDATGEGPFVGDPDIIERGLRSVLCAPIVHHGQLIGLLYLEHEQATGVFTAGRLDLLRHVAAQAAVSVENARLYAGLAAARDQAVAAAGTQSRFLMRMSHELRTPLNAIIGYAELIDEEVDERDPEAVRGDLRRIRGAADRLLRTLSNILELSSAEGGRIAVNLQTVDLTALLHAALVQVEPLAREQHDTVVLQLAPDLGSVATDPGKLEYCLVSLLDNACRFTRRGRVSLAAEVSAGGVRITVADTGIGIAPEHLGRLFQPFSQIDDSPTRRYDGAGVSLAVTRHFCDLLGIRLGVTSEPGTGTTFVLELRREFHAPA
ncbi:protein kinase domain-containing protein [Nannocystis pusilla]|uniref:histidine kinase n=1 Tax=Nannocystis pusilla TaxID=889268 RepID=A0ABS7TIG1_9BACT|nr:protein kinase [Nannocystis pusilla]